MPLLQVLRGAQQRMCVGLAWGSCPGVHVVCVGGGGRRVTCVCVPHVQVTT